VGFPEPRRCRKTKRARQTEHFGYASRRERTRGRRAERDTRNIGRWGELSERAFDVLLDSPNHGCVGRQRRHGTRRVSVSHSPGNEPSPAARAESERTSGRQNILKSDHQTRTASFVPAGLSSDRTPDPALKRRAIFGRPQGARARWLRQVCGGVPACIHCVGNIEDMDLSASSASESGEASPASGRRGLANPHSHSKPLRAGTDPQSGPRLVPSRSGSGCTWRLMLRQSVRVFQPAVADRGRHRRAPAAASSGTFNFIVLRIAGGIAGRPNPEGETAQQSAQQSD